MSEMHAGETGGLGAPAEARGRKLGVVPFIPGSVRNWQRQELQRQSAKSLSSQGTGVLEADISEGAPVPSSALMSPPRNPALAVQGLSPSAGALRVLTVSQVAFGLPLLQNAI